MSLFKVGDIVKRKDGKAFSNGVYEAKIVKTANLLNDIFVIEILKGHMAYIKGDLVTLSYKVGDKVVKKDDTLFLNGANVSVVTRVCKNTIKVLNPVSGRESEVSMNTVMPYREADIVETNPPWHPHDALIRKWLDNEDSVVEFNSGECGRWVKVENPCWNPIREYRVTLPNKEAAQLKQQIAVLQSRLKELEGENK